MVGAVSQCFVQNATILAELEAYWPNTAARTGDASGGCSFMCQFGNCFVDNMGLPVELLHFGVE